VVATGGHTYEPWLADVLGIDSVEPDLTLRGIRYAWDGIRRQTDAVLPESIARGPGT